MAQEDQDKGLPLIPCVYCSHANPPGFRFCGMCGKALPDLVKQASRSVSPTSVTPPTKPVPSPNPSLGRSTAPATHSSRPESPNRDLSYLLHDDHVPTRTSRVPFVVGGLILAAVAIFFATRGGKPSTTPAATDSATTPVAGSPSPAEASPTPSAAKTEASKTELPKPGPPAVDPKTESAKADTPAESTPPIAPRSKPAQHLPSVAKAKPLPQPSHLKKPSPAKPAAPAEAEEEASDSSAPASADCERQLPALRKAAARGDAKAKANLGLAYYAGRCVPRDLPTSYHWYALALRTEPDSPQVSAQLEAIWKQMSPAERQLALKAQ